MDVTLLEVPIHDPQTNNEAQNSTSSEKPKFGAMLRNHQKVVNSTAESRDMSTAADCTTLNTSLFGGSTSKELNTSVASSMPANSSNKSVPVVKSEVQKTKHMNRLSIEEENENAGSSDTESPGHKQSMKDV